METKKAKFDPELNRALYDKYITPRILGYIRHRCYLLAGHNDWEDVFQDAQLHIYRYIHTYNPEYPLIPWLKRAAKFAMYWYCQKYRKLTLTRSFDECLEAQAHEPEEIALSPENYRDHFSDPVVTALDKLSESSRRVFLLYLNGHTSPDIHLLAPRKKSSGENTTLSALKFNLWNTKKHLRSAMLAAAAS